MHTLFISDLHLTSQRQDITQAFVDFMTHDAPKAEALYILGDLFEFWIGDDDNSDLNQRVKSLIRSVVDSGTKCYFVQGNRDFLVGKKFAKETRATILDDETLIDLYGTPTILLHGDTLCTDDVKYLAFREKVHNPLIQFFFKRIPLHIRHKLVKKVQNEARNEKKQKSLDIMDVNKEEVVRVFQKHDALQMIHGHTHRPAIHNIDVNGKVAKRIVLGDWYNRSFVLKIDSNGCDISSKLFEE
jgi:UDP-2,3-diacylglucosamine hydrolase